MKKIRLNACILFCSCFLFQEAQTKRIDSLLAILKVAEKDTAFVNTLNSLCEIFTAKREIQKLDSVSKISLQLALKLDFKKGLAQAYSHVGFANFGLSNYKAGIDNSQKALEVFQRLGLKQDEARVLNTIGLNYSEQGDYGKTLEYFLAALSITEKLGDKEMIAASLGNLGNVYTYSNKNDKALEYYFRSVELNKQLHKEDLNAGNFHNIAIIYAANGKEKLREGKDQEGAEYYSKALYYYNEAASINEKSGNKMWLSKNLVGIGTVNIFLKDLISAHKNFDLALALSEEAGNKNGIITARIKIAEVYTRENKLKESDRNYQLALEMAKEINAFSLLQNIYLRLRGLCVMRGDDKNAVLYYREAVSYKDSLFNESKRKEITKAEMNYEFEKKEAALKAAQDKKDAVTITEKRKQKIVLVLICSVLLLVFVFSGLIYRSLKITKKQQRLIELKNKETEMQKNIIEEKNKDILDSIKYARRIQLSLMPTEKFLAKKLNKTQ